MSTIYMRIGSLVLLTVLFLVGCFGQGGPGDTVDRFFRALSSGECDAAMDMLVIDGVSLSESRGMVLAMYTEGCEEWSEDVTEASLEVLSEEIDGNRATVVVSILEDGEEEEEDFDLIRVGGRWKIEVDF